LDEMRQIIGVDSLGFLNIDDLPTIINKTEKCGYCDACFTNNYPTQIPTEDIKRKYQYKISAKEEE